MTFNEFNFYLSKTEFSSNLSLVNYVLIFPAISSLKIDIYNTGFIIFSLST